MNDSITLTPPQQKRTAKARPAPQEPAAPTTVQPIRTRLIVSCGWPDATAVPAKRVARRAA